MKNVLYFLVLLLLATSCEKKQIENLNEKNLNRYFDEVYDTNLSKDIRLKKLDSAIAIINTFKDSDSLKIKNLFKVSNRYFQLFEYDEYKNNTGIILKLAGKQHDSVAIAKANSYLGDYYFFNSKNDSAYYYYSKADKIYKILGTEDFDAGNTILHKAYVLLYEKDYIGSESQTIKALNLAEIIEDEELKYDCYSHLALTLSYSKDYDEALEYNQKALRQIDNVSLKNYIPVYKAQTFNSIGNIYLKLNKYNQAKEYFLKGLSLDNIKEINPLLFSTLLDYYAYTNFKMNQPSLEDFKKALFLRDSIDDTNGKINSRLHLTEYYLSKKDTLEALSYNTQAYNLAKEVNYNEDVLLALNLFTKIKPKEGLHYAQEYIKLSDSLQEQERNSRNKFARIEYETDEIIGEKEAISTEKKVILLSAIGIILVVGLLYIILYQRSKQRQLVFAYDQQQVNKKIYELMLNQQIKLEEARDSEKKRIARELHDGVMNRLTSTRLNLFILTKRRDEETIQKCISHIDDIQGIEKEVRSIAHDLSSELFSSNKNFKAVLEDLLQEQQRLHASNCTYYISDAIPWDDFSIAVKMNLYRILQESLKNCNKYANAKNIKVEISFFNRTLALTIFDDGKGFDVKKAKKGLGIKNMYERLNEMKAELNIDSQPNKGTTIKLLINLNKNE